MGFATKLTCILLLTVIAFSYAEARRGRGGRGKIRHDLIIGTCPSRKNHYLYRGAQMMSKIVHKSRTGWFKKLKTVNITLRFPEVRLVESILT